MFFSPPFHRGVWIRLRGRYIIQHQLGFIQVIRPRRKAGDAQRDCSLTAGMAMAAE